MLSLSVNSLRGVLMIAAFIMAIGFVSCRSNPSAPPVETPQSTTGVYVVNEGNFMRGNSTLTVYLKDSSKAYQDVFAAVNGRPLGDTGNDIVIHGGKAYVVVNGSQKIEVISLTDHKSVGTLALSGIRSPYKLAIVNEGRAYVTNLSDTSVTCFNPSTLQILTDRIKVGKNPMGILYANGKIYVCNSGFGYDSTVTVLNATTGALIRTVVVGDSPSEIGFGANNEVYVKCDGRSNWTDPTKDTPGALVAINADNDVIIDKVVLPIDTFGHPGRLATSVKGFGFFVSKNGIQQFRLNNSRLELNAALISSMKPYGLAYDEVGMLLYATDAKDYVQAGQVIGMNVSGVEQFRFAAGIIPGSIAFKR